MISQEQIRNLLPPKNRRRIREQGISLMLAVLVLSAVTAVAFSLAAIVLIEIRSSSDSLRTEPALYATFGVTEEALFQYKRFYSGAGMDVTDCTIIVATGDEDPPGDPNHICRLNNVSLTLPGTQPIEFDDTPRVELVGANTTLTLPMYQATSFDQQYDEVRIDVLPNSQNSVIEVFLVKIAISGTPECASGGTYPNCVAEEINPGTQYVFDEFDPLGDWQYELVLHNPSSSENVNVSIDTTRVGNEQPGGLPFVGEQVLRIVANYLGLTRTYQVRIPIP